MSIEVHDTTGESPLSGSEIMRIAQEALRQGGESELDLGVILVTGEALSQMHGRYLDDPTPTDVITFDLRGDAPGEEEHGPDGELYVSVDQVRVVAAERGRSFGDELALYVVHGALHLCGFDDSDEAERRRMRIAERGVLETLGYAVDDEFHRP